MIINTQGYTEEEVNHLINILMDLGNTGDAWKTRVFMCIGRFIIPMSFGDLFHEMVDEVISQMYRDEWL